MNNDLISRNEVIKVIDELGYVNCHDGKDYEANSRVDKIRQRLVEMPAACDVNKVLKKVIAEFDKRINANTQLKIRAERGHKMCGYAYAKSIEAYKEGRTIVKQAAKEFSNDQILCSERLPKQN